MTSPGSIQPECSARYSSTDNGLGHLCVVHAVGGQYMEQVLLSAVVPLPEHHVVSEGAVDIQVYLSYVWAVCPRYPPSEIILITCNI